MPRRSCSKASEAFTQKPEQKIIRRKNFDEAIQDELEDTFESFDFRKAIRKENATALRKI